MSHKPTIRSRMLLLPFLGALLVGGGRAPDVATLGIGAASAPVYTLPAPRQSLGASTSWLTPPLSDRRIEGPSGTGASGSGHRHSTAGGLGQLALRTVRTAPGRTVSGHATSVGSRLLGLSAFPANAPPKP